MKKEFTDVDFEMFIMPFGVHRNKTLEELPAQYILWISEEKFCPAVLAEYAENNYDELEQRASDERADYDWEY